MDFQLLATWVIIPILRDSRIIILGFNFYVGMLRYEAGGDGMPSLNA